MRQRHKSNGGIAGGEHSKIHGETSGYAGGGGGAGGGPVQGGAATTTSVTDEVRILQGQIGIKNGQLKMMVMLVGPTRPTTTLCAMRWTNSGKTTRGSQVKTTGVRDANLHGKDRSPGRRAQSDNGETASERHTSSKC